MADARGRWRWIGPVLGVGALAWVGGRVGGWTVDDAYITFRYAENLVAGHGPVYNPGERVEGYTTPLWMALLAGAHGLGVDTRTAAKVLGGACAVGTLGVLAQAHRAHPGIAAGAGAVAAAWVGACGIFAVWALGGMEVPLVALLLALTALAWLREVATGRAWMGAGLAGALALGARPDAAVVLGVLGLHALGLAWSRRALGPLRAPVLGAALYLPYFLARWAWYGWLLPNTFYAKVGASEAQLARGLEQVGSAGMALAPFLVGAALAVGGVVRARIRGQTPGPEGVPLGVLGGATLAQLAYVVAVGGDNMPAFRFLAGVLPLLGLVAGIGVARWPRLGPALLVAGVGWGLWQTEAHPELAPRTRRGDVGRNGEEVGRWLRDQVAPDALLATNTAGSVPYFSGLRTLDMLGLNDAHIAHAPKPKVGEGLAGHESADGAYVLGRAPDYVHLGSARGSARPVFRSDRELLRQPGFHQAYMLQRYRLPSGKVLSLYVKRSLVDSGRAPVALPPEPARRGGRR